MSGGASILEKVRSVFEPDVMANIDRTVRRIHHYITAGKRDKAMQKITMLAFDCDKYNKALPDKKKREKAAQKALFEYYVATAIPTVAAINGLVEFIEQDRVIEIHARLGLWGTLLSLSKVDMTMVETTTRAHAAGETYSPVSPYDTVIGMFDVYQEKYACLMMCCPGRQGDINTALYCLKAFTGFKIILIADSDDPIFEEIQKMEEWELAKDVEIPSWYGVDTCLWCYKRVS